MGLIGFVLHKIVHSSWLVVHCINRSYVHFGIQEIGFVLHNLLFLIDFTPLAAGAFQSGWAIWTYQRAISFISLDKWR